MAMQTLHQRWTAAGLFIGVGLLSWLSAMGVSRMGARMLALPEGAELVRHEPGEAPTPTAEDDDEPRQRGRARRPRKSEYVDPIVRRNIFDSTNVGADPTLTDLGDSDQKSDLKVVLLATVVAEPAIYSSALIAEEKGKGGAVGYGEGDDLLGEATIVRIEPRRVILRRTDGSIEYISMDDGKKVTRTASSSGDSEEDGVAKAGSNKWTVDQELFDKMLENPEKLYTQIRAVPHKGADGEIDGYRLSGIRRKSFFKKLGIKNGDIIHTVNGKSLTSMSSAMEAYNSLVDERDFTFELTRRNKQQTFEYEVR